MSVQTGTSHGGVPLPDGGVAEVNLDFEVLRELGDDRSRARAGGRRPARRLDPARRAVPPIPGGRDGRDPPRDGLPELALRSSGVPGATLHEASRPGAFENAPDERKDGQTDQQFVYTTRKKAIGPFKRELWDLSTKDEILATAHRKLTFLFQELRVAGTRELVDRYIRPVEFHRPLPEALRAVAPVR